MLIFAREAVVGNAQQRAERNFEADFFVSFADRALFKSLEEIHLASDDAPAACFGRPIAQR